MPAESNFDTREIMASERTKDPENKRAKDRCADREEGRETSERRSWLLLTATTHVHVNHVE